MIHFPTGFHDVQTEAIGLGWMDAWFSEVGVAGATIVGKWSHVIEAHAGQHLEAHSGQTIEVSCG